MRKDCHASRHKLLRLSQALERVGSDKFGSTQGHRPRRSKSSNEATPNGATPGGTEQVEGDELLYRQLASLEDQVHACASAGLHASLVVYSGSFFITSVDVVMGG